MDGIIYAPAHALASAIRARTLSVAEVVEAHLRRINLVNPRLNAVVARDDAAARAAAQAADAALAGGKKIGRLHGVPVTIKDSFDTVGLVSSGGTLGRARHLPDRDATVVERLRQAGAIVIGKTNTPELTLAFETDNLIYGRTSNPYDLSRSSGGSSGGAAAIVAAGGAALDVGSDTGGSVRVPAHFCGVVGLRPTSGRLSRAGHILPPGGLIDALTQPGLLARSAEDVALVMPLLIGADWRDSATVDMPFSDPRIFKVRAMRVAIFTDNGVMAPDPQIAACVERAGRALRDAHARVEEARPEGIAESAELFFGLIDADGGALVDLLLDRYGTKRRHPWLQQSPDRPALPPRELAALLLRLEAFRSRMLGFMQRYDVIICPPCAFVAPPHGSWRDPSHLNGFSYTAAYNLTGWPAAVVPCGQTPAGLPIGVQVVARPWCEDIALAVALFLEATFGGWRPSGQLPPP